MGVAGFNGCAGTMCAQSRFCLALGNTVGGASDATGTILPFRLGIWLRRVPILWGESIEDKSY